MKFNNIEYKKFQCYLIYLGNKNSVTQEKYKVIELKDLYKDINKQNI